MPVISRSGKTTFHIVGSEITDQVLEFARIDMRHYLDGGLDYIDAAYQVAVNEWIGLTHEREGDEPRNIVFHRLIEEFRPAGVERPSNG